ncbi:CLUMA_CG003679, isoform B [Clunio marinus]|nr:CLUMA_CG003679, isoform B [Clunio marinus]
MLNQNEIESIRSLRSERRRKNVKNSSNKFSMDDFYEGDDIPQQLLSDNEQMLDVCDDKTDHKAAMSILDFYDDARELLNYRNTLISMEDYKSLQYSGLLTNGVIDFYLQYVYHELLSEEMQAKIHICSVDFYSSYAIDPNFSGWKSDGSKAVDKRYNFVKDIPSNQFLNFFEKDFIVFPCNVREHWLLAIVCYPKLNGVLRIEDGVRVSLEEAKRNIKDPSAGKPVKQSCILIFDSVKKSARSTVVIQHLRNFFVSEYKAKYGRLFEFSAVNLFGASLKVPYQDNATDCGLFLLEFFEHFFIKSPIEDYRLPLQLDNWFDSDIILDKREQIATVIKSLMVTLHPGQDILSELPPLKFHADTMDIETINLEEDKNLVSNNNEETFNNNNDFNVIDKHKSEESDTLLTVEDANAQE